MRNLIEKSIERNSTGCVVQVNTRLPTGNKGNEDLHRVINIGPTVGRMRRAIFLSERKRR